MSCDSCANQFKTVSRFFSVDGQVDKINKMDCKKQIPYLQKAIAHLRPYVYMLPGFGVSHEVDVNETITTTPCRIYKIAGWYGQGTSDCITPKANCDPCREIAQYCGCKYGIIDMKNMMNVPMLDKGEYSIECVGGRKIRYNLPSCVSKAYVVYYRMFDTITDEDDLIQIPEYLYPGLQMLLAYHSSINGSYNSGEKAEFAQDFSNFIQVIRETFAEYIPSKFTFKNINV